MNPLRFALLGLLSVLCACAWGPGDSFGTVSGELSAAVDPAGRETADGWLRLSSDYELRLDQVVLTAGEVQLQARSGGATTFDPANPPPGYSLCHGGHCHSADGRLVPYDEIAAELAGGSGAAVTVAALRPPTDTIDVQAGASALPLTCVDSCDLPATNLRRVSLPLTSLTASGAVRDRRVPARLDGEVPFRFALPEEDTPLALTASVELAVDRTEPPLLRLAILLSLSPEAFDAVDWSAFTPEPDGSLDLEAEANHEALDALLASIAGTSLTAQVTRSHR